MKSPRLILPFGHQDANAVNFIAYLDLATESAVILNIEGKIQNVLLQLVWFAAKALPFFRDINVTGRAGT